MGRAGQALRSDEHELHRAGVAHRDDAQDGASQPQRAGLGPQPAEILHARGARPGARPGRPARRGRPGQLRRLPPESGTRPSRQRQARRHKGQGRLLRL